MRRAQCNAEATVLRSKADSLADIAADPMATDYWRRQAAAAEATAVAKESECANL